MSKGKQEGSESTEVAVGESKALLCVREAGGVIKNSAQFKKTMSCLIGDLLEGAITPRVGNAVCNAGGKLLKVVELELRYGRALGDGQQPAPTPQLSLQ